MLIATKTLDLEQKQATLNLNLNLNPNLNLNLKPIIHHFWNSVTLPFRYDNAESQAGKYLLYGVHHGETLAIMDDIGSGKSTITNLIPRLFSHWNLETFFKVNPFMSGM